jgi:hypothetical protein
MVKSLEDREKSLIISLLPLEWFDQCVLDGKPIAALIHGDAVDGWFVAFGSVRPL